MDIIYHHGNITPKFTTRGWINGFIPFAVISASVIFSSEYLVYKNVNPSIVGIKKRIAKSLMTDLDDDGDTDTGDDDSDIIYNIITGDHDDKKMGSDNFDIDKQSSDVKHAIRLWNYLEDDEKKERKEFFQNIDSMGYLGSMLNARVNLQAIINFESKNNDYFDKNNSDLFIETMKSKVYCLCTNDKPLAGKDGKWIYKLKKRNNVFYVTNVIGQYPWNEYKNFVMDLLQTDKL